MAATWNDQNNKHLQDQNTGLPRVGTRIPGCYMEEPEYQTASGGPECQAAAKRDQNTSLVPKYQSATGPENKAAPKRRSDYKAAAGRDQNTRLLQGQNITMLQGGTRIPGCKREG
jgi:hypothetical protein